MSGKSFRGTNDVDKIMPGESSASQIYIDELPKVPNEPIPTAEFAGNDTIQGLGGNDTLKGDEGDDSIMGGDGNDSLIGWSGDDTLNGGGAILAGTNTIDGGEERETTGDWVSYSDATLPVTVDLALQVGKIGGFQSDFIVWGTIENVLGSIGQKNTLTGDFQPNILVGGNFKDTINIGAKDKAQGGLDDDEYKVAALTDATGSQIEDTGGSADVLTFPVNIIAAEPTTTGVGLERQGKNLAVDADKSGKIELDRDLLIVNFYADKTSKTQGDGFIETVGGQKGTDILNAAISNVTTPPTPTPTTPTPTPTTPTPTPTTPTPTPTTPTPTPTTPTPTTPTPTTPTPTPTTPTPTPTTPTPTPTPGGGVSWTKPVKGSTDPGSDSPAPGGGNTVFTDDKGVKAYVFSNGSDNAVVPGEAVGLYIQGLNGHDNITGGSNADNINGNLGDDIVNGAGGDDGDRTLVLPDGIIRVALRGGKGSDNLDGGDGDDLLNGNQDNDIIMGGIGNDIVRGGKGDDLLTGGLGDDFLIGDAGRDQLTGNEGVDTFILEGSATAAISRNSADVITDFLAGTDRIMLPGNTTFEQLQLNPISLQVDGDTAVTSTAIEIGTTVFAIVQGVTPDKLTSGNFISTDNIIVSLG